MCQYYINVNKTHFRRRRTPTTVCQPTLCYGCFRATEGNGRRFSLWKPCLFVSSCRLLLFVCLFLLVGIIGRCCFNRHVFFFLRRDKFWDACCTLTRLVEMYMVRIGVDNQNVYQWKRKHSVRLSDYGGSTDDIGDRTRKQRWEDSDLSTDLMGGPSSNYFPNTTGGFVQRFYDASFDVPKENKNLKRTQHPCNLILA